MIGAIPCRRGCGPSRVSGGIYAEVGLTPGGHPIEDLLLCPPTVLNDEAQHALGVTPVGITQVEREGVWHLLDWVGAIHYPNVADFIEEARRFGVSRRVSSGLDFHKLTTDSRLILIHPRGWIRDAEPYYLAMPFLHRSGNPYSQGGAHTCPKGWPTHNRISDPPQMCAQLWWQDVDGGVPTGHPDYSDRHITRAMPSFTYPAFAPPPKVDRKWTPAIFGSFPITRLVVVRDHAGNTDAKNLARASAARGIPTAVEDS